LNLDAPPSRDYFRHVSQADVTDQHRELAAVAERLFWWMSPADALRDEIRFVAQVMALGTDRDVARVEERLGGAVFECVLDHPPTGLFTPRRWNYWHVRQHRTPVPPLPQRFPR
jgi:hypothetical protein